MALWLLASIVSLLCVAANSQHSEMSPPHCEGGIPAYLLVSNQRILDSNATVFRGISEAGCLDMCTFQQDLTGKKLNCASVVYDQPEKQCLISAQSSKPAGTMEMKANNGAMYYEKVCLPKGISPSCKQAVFQRYPQAILAGFAEKAVPASNYSACVRACAEAPSCKSALYYYEDSECVLNTERALNHVKSFLMEKKDKVDYFDNGCLLESKTTLGRMVKPVEVAKNESAVVKTEESKSKTEAIEEGNDVNVTSWSPFFPCDKVSGFQIRTRSCKVSQCKEKLVDAQLCKEAEKVSDLNEADWSDWLNDCKQLSGTESCIGVQSRTCKGLLSNCQGPKTRYCFPKECAQA